MNHIIEHAFLSVSLSNYKIKMFHIKKASKYHSTLWLQKWPPFKIIIKRTTNSLHKKSLKESINCLYRLLSKFRRIISILLRCEWSKPWDYNCPFQSFIVLLNYLPKIIFYYHFISSLITIWPKCAISPIWPAFEVLQSQFWEPLWFC